KIIFFAAKPASKTAWTKKLWVYDYRTNVHKTLKENKLKCEDFNEFEDLYKPEDRSKRKATWSEKKPDGRWRAFTYDELVARDKTNLDIFWLKDESLEDTENLPAPGVLAAEIVEQLEAALEEFRAVEEVLAANEEVA
ncbi:MAG: SAM-dependent DNA methyltransferase, partial [Acidobacteria bacterium]|nr:SAM-dependent DNA methyltransferase [Acidobacteriota bacterium]